MSVVGKDTINHNKNPFDMWYNLNNNGVTLSPATTYYWQCYATVNGVIYYGSVQSFTTTGNRDPIGRLDAAVGDYGKIFVRGWAFDYDDTGAQLKIHVYVGGPAGDSNAECITKDINGNEIIANTERTDVNDVYNCGSWHGYDVYIPTTKVGNQDVYVYAINNVSGNNPCIGSGSINIPSDTESPVISNINVTNITKDGYTVYCDITDNVGITSVKFPTWTLNETDGNSQDDLVWHTYSENVNSTSVRAWYRVKTSEHNNENGIYATHIYALDKAGNQAFATVPDTDVEPYYDYTPIDVFEYNGNLYAVYDNAMSYSDIVSLCEQMGGHIATINSQAENDEITKHLNNGYYYIGYNNLTGTWSYGESDYRNWNTGEPNNMDGIENCTVMFSGSGVWNDTSDEQYKYGILEQSGFILEIEGSSIQLKDTKYFNNNKYEIYNTLMPYSVAKFYAESKGGHLLTLTSEKENTFIQNLINGWTWLALTDKDNEGNFVWTTGEDTSYTNWNDGEPNNEFNEDYAAVKAEGTWNDFRNQQGCYVVIEYDNAYTDNSKIYVSKKPAKTEYEINENLDLTGGTISGDGNNGYEEWDIFDAPMTNSMFTVDASEFNNQLAGTYTIYIHYQNATASFDVTVKDAATIYVSKLPTKTVYAIGEELDLSGGTISGNGSSGYEKWDIFSSPMTNFSVNSSEFNNQAAGKYTIYISYAGATTSFDVTVEDNSTSNVYIYGDVNADNMITANDAAIVLQKTLDNAYKMPIQNKIENWLKYADVNADGLISADDAANILQKTLDSTYKMPVER
jgi:hypothetical protein